MSLKDLTKERAEELAMIDIATLILEEENKALNFREVFDRVAKIKGLTEAQMDMSISQFYTDLNIDGRFMTKGSNLWGLKRWYPVEEIDEDITPVPKKKKKKKAAKKKKKKAPVEELDETEDLDESIDQTKDNDIVGFDDEDLDAVEDLSADDDDFDFDDDEDLDDDIDEDFDDDEEDDEEESSK
ncbi:DNA-directed RNA polymerase subunit delta [Gracilibacillus caseinilyticus]|uniref:Probable DNA-directed RNA polymerase subunit delta n=1 Tax=Gracilibacillus caseinilyticus TaxID=2932256 RepID=A0ABY4F0N8_9BACI|nr:DNA-directed RNA polymerase subunit delta [Gracilibacillus caseinilyticus]UOQ50229.1 DNA-directed RNA polymerase subunit delta [Gracilibacillus caseinilyticus]